MDVVHRRCATRGYRPQAREGPIKVISEQMTNVDGCYLALLYLGGYYLPSLLYDVNQQVALLQQLVFLPRRVHLDRSTDKRQSQSLRFDKNDKAGLERGRAVIFQKEYKTVFCFVFRLKQ